VYIRVLLIKKVISFFSSEKYRNKRNAVITYMGQGFRYYGEIVVDVRCKVFTGCAHRLFFEKYIFFSSGVPLYRILK